MTFTQTVGSDSKRGGAIGNETYDPDAGGPVEIGYEREIPGV